MKSTTQLTNTNKLKSKIVENGFTITSLAKILNTSKTTLSQKANNKIKFSTYDLKEISRVLKLTPEEITEIFLN